MFILYAVVAGLVAGFALGGRLERLEAIRFRWPWLATAGLAVQLALFSPPAAGLPDPLGPLAYVGSTLLVLAAVVANARIPGLVLVVLGAASNLAAIVANGGRMPADPGALAALGQSAPGGATNSVVVPDPALRLLTDQFALPAWLPFANVFSIGDVLIALGIAIAIAAAMRARPAA